MKTMILIGFLLCCVFATYFAHVPKDWQLKIDSNNGFYAENDLDEIQSNGYPGIYMPLLGNGYLSMPRGVRSNIVYVSGLFNNETTSPSHRAMIPSSFDVVVTNSYNNIGSLLDIEHATYSRRGMLSNTTSWYELKWYAHRSIRSLLVLELRVFFEEKSKEEEKESVTLELSYSENIDSVDIDFEKSSTHENSMKILCGNTNIPETEESGIHKLCVISSIIPKHITITKDQSGQVITFLTSIRTSLDSSNVRIDAIKDYELGILQSKSEMLYASHVHGWNKLWKSGVEISGRPDVAQAINVSFYSILSSVREDWPYGLAPGGLTNSYNGHSFWDTETWMYPPLLFLYPAISQSLIMYRYLRLDGARTKALSYQPPFAGTMFPWESAFSGVETCPTDAFTGLREDHISGDIAYAVWQEWCAREDKVWLEQYAYPILTGIADFWISIATYETLSDGSSIAHINNIIPPDEYADHVNDSIYTNYVASQSLRYMVQATEILNKTCANCESYTKLANHLVILYDNTLGIHPEYFGYDGKTIKQADVVLLHYPLGMEMNKSIQKADLEYYSERTDHHGPAMTWGMHSIGYVDLQEYDQAASYFNMSFQDNIQKPLPVWTETPDGNAANFITGAGGFIQTMISGYPGIRLSYGQLSFSPICPEYSTSVKVRSLSYLGNIFDLEYDCEVDDTFQSASYANKIMLTRQSISNSNDDYPHKIVVLSEDLFCGKKSSTIELNDKPLILFPCKRSKGDIPFNFIIKKAV